MAVNGRNTEVASEMLVRAGSPPISPCHGRFVLGLTHTGRELGGSSAALPPQKKNKKQKCGRTWLRDFQKKKKKKLNSSKYRRDKSPFLAAELTDYSPVSMGTFLFQLAMAAIGATRGTSRSGHGVVGGGGCGPGPVGYRSPGAFLSPEMVTSNPSGTAAAGRAQLAHFWHSSEGRPPGQADPSPQPMGRLPGQGCSPPLRVGVPPSPCGPLGVAPAGRGAGEPGRASGAARGATTPPLRPR